jgi:hypothetical protein
LARKPGERDAIWVPGGQVGAGTEVADMDTDPCSAEVQ